MYCRVTVLIAKAQNRRQKNGDKNKGEQRERERDAIHFSRNIALVPYDTNIPASVAHSRQGYWSH